MVRLSSYLPAVLGTLLLSSSLACAQTSIPGEQGPKAEQGPIRVATRLVPPLVVEDKGQYTGFSIELLKKLFIEMGIPDTPGHVVITPYDNIGEQLTAVSSGQADLAIAAISITAERE